MDYTEEEATDEESSGVAAEEVIYKEPTVYDNLLMKLGTSSKSLADAFKMRYFLYVCMVYVNFIGLFAFRVLKA